MRASLHPQMGARRGYTSMIGLLIVIVIIALLLQQGYFKKNSQTGVTQARTYVDKGEATACAANRATISGRIQEMTTSAGGERPALNTLRQALGTTGQCPAGGKIQVDGQGTIYCTEHAPAPESRMMSLDELF